MVEMQLLSAKNGKSWEKNEVIHPKWRTRVMCYPYYTCLYMGKTKPHQLPWRPNVSCHRIQRWQRVMGQKRNINQVLKK